MCVGFFSSWSGEKERHSQSSVEASGMKTTLGGREEVRMNSEKKKRVLQQRGM